MKKNKQTEAQTNPLVQHKIKKTAKWKPYLVLTVFAFVLYSNTLNHSFVLDDSMVITNNKFTQEGIKGIPDIFRYDTFVGWHLTHVANKTAEDIQKEFKAIAGGRYRPLSLATFAMEIQFFGKKNEYPNGVEFFGNAFVSHLNNILLYLLTACLLYLILSRLFPPQRDDEISRYAVNKSHEISRYARNDDKWYLSFPFIASLLFLAHPIHTEAIANIKGRDEIMTLLGSLAALWFTIKYFDTRKKYNLFLSGLCLFLGLLSKENAITFLAVIPITIYYFILRPLKGGVKFHLGDIGIIMIPLFAASAVFLLIRANILGVQANMSADGLGLMDNPFLNATKSETFATIFYTLFIYIKLLFFPHPLTWDYYPYHIEIVNWTNPVVILSVMFYSGITIYALYGLFKKKDAISYSIWFYLLPLTVVSNLFFPIGVFMAERFIFISSIGFCIFIGWLISKFTKNIKASNYLTSLVLIIILSLYSVKTISRNKVWKDNFTLHTTDVKTSKNSAKGNYIAGLTLLRAAIFPSNEIETQKKDELYDRAFLHLKRTLELYPQHDGAIEELGNLYFERYKDIVKTLSCYAMVLERNTALNSAKFVFNQTVKLLHNNQTPSTPEEIIHACDKLLKIKPDVGEAYYIKGVIYYKYLDNDELSLINIEKADSFDFPKTIDFYNYAGIIYGISGNYEKAIQYLLKAIELGSNDYATYINLGTTYKLLGDIKNANFYMNKGNEMKEVQRK